MMSLASVLVMCLSLCVPAFASVLNTTPGTSDIGLEKSRQETVLAIEDALTMEGTGVEAEMTELINAFRAKQKNCSAESYQKLQALINSASDLMNAYINYQRNGVALTSASGATKVGIAEIVTYGR